ncbi:MAG: methyltransferase, TrmH family [Solirubrobacteraceae bacterium]|jgi:TrmH family RNA methyltransferase|nr:methyltransferase, TrmH family [Solirubrobacteraceae bacterium]
MTITSSHNEKLKEIRKLARRRARDERGRFVAEGEDLVAAAWAAGWEPLALLAAAGSGLEGEEVEPALLAGVSSLGSGTRQLGVFEERWAAPAGPLCVALWGVGDPGNVGAIMRSALAFGAASVVVGPGSADPFGPKAVRASMGAIFAVAVARAARVEELPGERVALVARGGEPLTGPAAGDTTLVVGAERDGLAPDVIAACDRVAHIPIASESLNAAMAATVALYELGRGDGPRMAPA